MKPTPGPWIYDIHASGCPDELNDIVDKVLAYKPKPKSNAAVNDSFKQWWALYLEPNSGFLVTLWTDWHTPPWWIEEHMKLSVVEVFHIWSFK